MRGPGRILLVSCYEQGHAPHGLALPKAFLERAGFAPRAVDLAIERLPEAAVDDAGLIAISVPMHTALRLGVDLARRILARRPRARVGFFGHYAVLNRAFLDRLGAAFVLGGECEQALVELVEAADVGADGEAVTARVELRKLSFPRPSRAGLPAPAGYARLDTGAGAGRVIGYTETTRGCLDTCRHCPIPVVYGGRLFAIDAEVVLADVAAQVEAGAGHITFGDPDFFNGPSHGMRVLRSMHQRWPALSFDITAQVTHLLRHRRYLDELVELGCAFVVSAIESVSDGVLAALGKRHRRAEVERLLDACADAGLVLRPTFVTFTPWTSRADLRDLVELVVGRGLVDHVDPVQLTIRLLVPPGSLLLQAHPDRFGALDEAAFTHAWRHPDPVMDGLQAELAALVADAAERDQDPGVTFAALRDSIYARAFPETTPPPLPTLVRRRVPRVTEPWFC
ncbi:CUAEP/CCAEP-tail radical SAM (seleno)protein [Haliangium sp.]|uniref:CUAEP/CCAEP-tail radical SAM (seleno)protein n=1 Tax=Haliangium sp. TaxID=2663208 RepID=UPI003D11FF77